MLAPSALEHLILALVGVGGQVSHVGDVHDAVHIVPGVAQVLLQHVLHDVGAQVADVGKWYTVGPQVYISTWPGVWVLNSSFLWVAELYRYMMSLL